MEAIPTPLPFEYHKIARQILSKVDFVRFCHLGRTPESGFDCVGHFLWFFHQLGIVIPIPTEGMHYPRDFWKCGIDHVYQRCLTEHFAVLPIRAMEVGDMPVFSDAPGSGRLVHTGICTDSEKGEFQHVFAKRGVCYNRIADRFWSDRILGVMRSLRFGELRNRAMTVPRVFKR